MATVPDKAYLGDTNEYIDWCNKWGGPYFHRLATFEEGPIGEKAQRNLSGFTDGFDSNAGGSTYSDEMLFKGRQVCKVHAPQGSLGSLSFGGSFHTDVLARRGQRVWSQATLYLDSSKTSLEEVMRGSGGWKLMRQRVTNPNHSVGHADIYFNAIGRNPDKAFYFACEAQTSTSTGHDPHNSITNIGDRSEIGSLYDRWFDIQYMTLHDVGHNGEERTRLMAWVNDDLIGDVETTSNTNRHTLIADDDEISLTHFCTFINTSNNHPDNPNYDPDAPVHGLSEDQTWYLGAYEVTNKEPEYTDAHGNPKLPPRVIA